MLDIFKEKRYSNSNTNSVNSNVNNHINITQGILFMIGDKDRGTFVSIINFIENELINF